MHCHHVLLEGWQVNQFSGDKYAGLSETALYYIGGIIKHARALNAFTNPRPTPTSGWCPASKRRSCWPTRPSNRSASIRIPYVPARRRAASRCASRTPSSNPYLGFAALLMAGIDGIQNKIHPGDALDKNLYDLPPEERQAIPTVAHTLEMALQALDKDRAFLTAGGVF
jgi:glutamine synthetase